MAGLIPQRFIDDLLDRIDIIEVIGARINLKKSGKNYSALCPFHQEKTPSFTVEPQKQFYYCFGCGAGGNSLQFVLDYDRLEFPDAIEALAKSIGLEVPRESRTEQQPQRLDLYSLMNQTSAFYQQQLRSHPAASYAVDYLKKRGLSGQVAKRFGIGFAPPGWDNLIRQFGQEDAAKSLLIEGGMAIEKKDDNQYKCYDRFRDRIMFPIRDVRGRTIAFGGRVLGDEKPKYLNSPETPIFHKSNELYGLYEARQCKHRFDHFIIVEGYMDVVALAQHGVYNAVATLGTATSETHLKRLYRLVPDIVFCFDGDQAGRNAAWKALNASLNLMHDGRQARFLFLPDGEDPDSLIRHQGSESFKALVEMASPLSDFLFDHLKLQVNFHSMAGRAQFHLLAKPLVDKIPAGIFHDLMDKRLQELTGLTSSSLDRDFPHSNPFPNNPGTETVHGTVDPAGTYQVYPSAQASNNSQRSGFKADKPYNNTIKPRKNIDHSPCAKAIALLFIQPGLATKITTIEQYQQLKTKDIQLFLQLVEFLLKQPTATTGMMLGYCKDSELGQQLVQMAMKEQFLHSDAEREQEFNDTLLYLRELYHKQQQSGLYKDKHSPSELSNEEKARLKALTKPHNKSH